jgi:hypothetical protein
MTSHTTKRGEEQFLGEIQTEIAGTTDHKSRVRAGEAMRLRREPDNQHDPNAIRVQNSRSRTVGYLPRKTAAWLAPLIDDGRVRVEGYVLSADDVVDADRPAVPLAVVVFLTQAGLPILRQPTAEDRLNNLHGLALQALDEVQSLEDPAEILRFTKGLEHIAREQLLPETRLLLALIPSIAREARAAQGLQTLASFRARLENLVVGTPLAYAELSFFPLFWPESDVPPYVLLSHAIANGTAVVEEISENGSVPHLRLVNKALRPLLIVEGEILVGAKQNRMVNVTTLVAAKSTFTLPVSCVEQGRWHFRSRSFESQFCAPPSLRQKKLRSVQRNRRSGGEARSDQGEVWEEVQRCLAATNVESETQSLADGLAQSKRRIDADRQRLELPPDAAGVVVAQAGRIVGMDLFDAPTTFTALWPRLVEGYVFDCQQRPGQVKPQHSVAVDEFLKTVAGQARHHPTALGLGDELEINGGELVGAALIYDSRICHLSAFAAPDVRDQAIPPGPFPLP